MATMRKFIPLGLLAMTMAVTLLVIFPSGKKAAPTSVIDAGVAPAMAPPHNFKAPAPGYYNMFYASGNAVTDAGVGTVVVYTVPSGTYVTGVSAHTSIAGAYMTIAPYGIGYTGGAPVVGPQISIPNGAAFSLGKEVLFGSLSELGPGSVLTFYGVDTYYVQLTQVQ